MNGFTDADCEIKTRHVIIERRQNVEHQLVIRQAMQLLYTANSYDEVTISRIASASASASL